MPKKIPVRTAQVGQVLGEAVVQGEHQVLLREGTELDAGHLELLRQRGVALLTIQTDEGESSAEDGVRASVDEARLKEILLEESRWFGEARKDDFMAEVFRWVVAHRTGRGEE